MLILRVLQTWLKKLVELRQHCRASTLESASLSVFGLDIGQKIIG